MEQDILSGVWPEWQVVRQIGRGSFGVVYEVVRRDHSVESHAAVKVISTPQNKSEIDSLRAEGLSEEATRTYLQGVVNDFVSEIQLMESFKGVQNIVSVEDYKVVEKKDEIGWDIYIRMELLTPFNSYVCDKTLSEQEVIKLGIDMCTALELCARCNIIHRDIKPENIFVNPFGDFKLGDFGIARKLENVTGGLSQKGTYNYMAPEIEKGSQYDATVDLYSLGLVLYRLLNRNRLPFLDTDRQLLNPNERMNAVRRRMDGEPLPPPCDASPAMAQIILCACSYEPERRFSSAAAMKKALIAAGNGMYTVDQDVWERTRSVRPAAPNPERTAAVPGAHQGTNSRRSVDTFGEKEKPKKKKSKVPLMIALVLMATLLIGGGAALLPRLLDKQEANTEEDTASQKNDSDEKEDDVQKEDDAQREDDAKKEDDAQKKDDDQKSGVYADLLKTYIGTYTSNQNVRGFELTFTSCDQEGNLTAVYEFYDLYGENKIYGSYNIEGKITTELSDGSIIASTKGVEWVVSPGSSYNMSDREFTFNPDKTLVTSEETNFYGIAENTPGMYEHDDIVKKYTGTYVPGWGVTSAELTITSCDENTGEVQAEFAFAPHEHNAEAQTGSFVMNGKVIYEYPDGSLKLALMGDQWIQKPEENTKMLSFYLTISPERDKATSDLYQIYLTA